MTRNIPTPRAPGAALAMMAALAFASTFPEPASAHSTQHVELWKLNPAKTNLSPGPESGGSTLSLERDEGGMNSAASNVMVISNGNVYLATGPVAAEVLASKRVDTSKLVQIGKNARSTTPCGSHCMAGLRERKATLTFTPISISAQQIANALSNVK